MNPEPEKRRHPLEQRPVQPPPEANQSPRQRVNLRIPSVNPTATYILIGINVAIFLVRALSRQVDVQLFEWGANNSASVLQQGEYYRLFTSMFLHASIYGPFGRLALEGAAHIFFNMYALYAIGGSLERLIGHARFLLIYLLGGLTGSLFSAIYWGIIAHSPVSSVGASGAVFAILGAEFIYLYHHRKLLGAAGRQRRQTLIVLGIMNLAVGFLSNIPGSGVTIDNWAHIGGLVGGLVLAWFISPILNLRIHPDHPDEILGEDVNPLNKKYWIVSAYATVLIVVLFVGVMIARR
jgi:rhomboid protease GluP